MNTIHQREIAMQMRAGIPYDEALEFIARAERARQAQEKQAAEEAEGRATSHQRKAG
jgi:hypothetical protein